MFLVGCTVETPVVKETLPLAPETEPEPEEPILEPGDEDVVAVVEDLPDSSVVSVEELSSHNKEEDCWVSYDGKVYDITDYIPRHPGGKSAIERRRDFLGSYFYHYKENSAIKGDEES